MRRALAIDVSANLLFGAYFYVTQPFLGLILRRDLGATPFQLSVMASAGAASMLLSLLWARFLRDRTPLPFVVWPTFAARALYLLVPLAGTAWALIAVVVASTLLTTSASPAQAVLIQRIYPRGQRGRALGLVRTAGGLVAVAAAPVAGALLALVSFRWVYAAAGVLGMAASLRLRRLTVPPPIPGRPSAAARPGLRTALAAVREDIGLRGLMAAIFAAGLGIWMQMPALPIMLADILRVSTDQLGVFAALGAAAGLAGNVVWGRGLDRRASLRVLQAVVLVGLVTPLALAVARSPWVLILTATADGLLLSGLELAGLMALLDVAGPEHTAHYAAIGTTLVGIRGLIGPPLGAFIIHTVGVRAAFVAAAALMLVGLLLLTRLARTFTAQPVPAPEPLPLPPPRA